MTVSVGSHAKLLTALLAAGVVAATPAVNVSAPDRLPTLSTAAVQPASVITDVLYNLGDVGHATANGALIAADAALGMNFYADNRDIGFGVPFDPAFAALIALQHPDQIGSLLSYVVQLYGNPAESFTLFTYPWYLKDYVLQPLASLLPAPLGQAVFDAINGVAEGINDILSALPDPHPAADAMADLYRTDFGRATYSVQAGIQAPVQLVWDIADWASYVPGDVEASIESAIRNPSEIPGLLSYLTYTVLNPNVGEGLLGNIASTLKRPLVYLPAPIGGPTGLATNIYDGFVDGVINLLKSVLPTPVTPTPFPSTRALPAAKSLPPSRNNAGQQQISGLRMPAVTDEKSAGSAPGTTSGAEEIEAATHPKKGNLAKDAAVGTAKPEHPKPAGGAPNSQRHARPTRADTPRVSEASRPTALAGSVGALASDAAGGA